MEIRSLYDLAQQQNIGVCAFPLPETGSMSVMTDSGACFIGMDETVKDGGVQERVHLSHELGHCMTGSFYNQYVSLDVRRKHENRADFWMVTHLAPAHKLSQLIEQGLTEPWQMAEALDVSQHVIETALRLYSRKSML